MILDIRLKDNKYNLILHKKVFENTSTPLDLLQQETPLMEKYGYLGKFSISGELFGFDGCFKKYSEDLDYVYYSFDLQTTNKESLRKMIITVYVISYYFIEDMHFHKEFFENNIWYNQSLSFVIFNGEKDRCGYSIGGQIYPWFRNKLKNLSETQLIDINKYVSDEISKVSLVVYNKDVYCKQVSIMNETFFIQVNLDGRWINWKSSSQEKNDFSSHNIDFRQDQEICFASIVLINTWLRNNT